MNDPDNIPLYKLTGPLLVMVTIGLFFLGMFIGGFYWQQYVFPTLNGSWVVSSPGKYFVMTAFLLFSMVAFGVSTPICRFKSFLTIASFVGFVLFALGSLVFFR